MKIVFPEGTELNVVSATEEKKLFSKTETWELTISSSTDISSEDLDALLVAENLTEITFIKDDDTSTRFLNYTTVNKVHKAYYVGGVTTTLILRKEVPGYES